MSHVENILAFARRHMLEHGRFPTHRAICKAVGLRSSCSSFYYLSRMEELGHVRRGPKRTWELVQGPPSYDALLDAARRCPHCAAGLNLNPEPDPGA